MNRDNPYAHRKPGRRGYAFGGGIHKVTPSKHKPHMAVNVINVNRGQKNLAPHVGGGVGRLGLGNIPLAAGSFTPTSAVPAPGENVGPPAALKRGGRVGRVGSGDGSGRTTKGVSQAVYYGDQAQPTSPLSSAAEGLRGPSSQRAGSGRVKQPRRPGWAN
jgi:hypothetical protein